MILITGATGLVGSHVAQHLYHKNYPVKALKRNTSSHSFNHEIKWFEGDILDSNSLYEIIDHQDIVIHCAAKVSFNPGEKKEMFLTNVQGTANVVNVCLEKKVKQLVHISSVAALGRDAKSNTIREDSPWEASDWSTYYGISKYQAELEVWRGMQEGLPAVILNPSTVLGYADWNQSSTRLFKYIAEKNTFYPKGKINYIDVRDLADIVFQVIEKQTIGERFIVNAGAVYYQELFEKIAREFQVPAPKIKVKPWMAEIAWRLEKIKAWASGKKPLITKETARQSQQEYYFDNHKVQSFLDYRFRDLEDTLTWVCQALKEHYKA